MYYYDVVIAEITDSNDKNIFYYDKMANKILDVIEELTGSRDPFFTWLLEAEIEEGKKNYRSIESISGPLK